MQKVTKAVIPAAGLGTRFLPLTKAIPKALLPLVDKPVIQWIVEEAVSSGIDEIVFIIDPKEHNAIEAHFAKDETLEQVLEAKGKTKELESIRHLSDLATFHYVDQHEQLGLGHAVHMAKDIIGDNPFIVCGSDDIIQSATPACAQLIEVYEKNGGPVMGACEVDPQSVNRYGVADPDGQLVDGVVKMKGMVEKPPVEEAPSNIATCARWLLTPDIFDALERTEPGAGGEIQLTDAVMKLIEERGDVYAKVYDGTYWDCGNKQQYLKAIVAFSLESSDFGEEMKDYLQGISF